MRDRPWTPGTLAAFPPIDGTAAGQIAARFVPFVHRAILHLVEKSVQQTRHPRFELAETIALGTAPAMARRRGPGMAAEPRKAERRGDADAPGVYAFERDAGRDFWR